MFLSLLFAAAAASEPAVLALPSDEVVEWTVLLDAAADLRAAGDIEASRATLDLVFAQPLPDEIRARAERQRAELPMTRRQASAVLELATVQALAGSYLLGPHVARLSYDPSRSATPYYLGAAGGAVLGAGTALLIGMQPAFDRGEGRAMVLGEVLGGATGVAIGFALDDLDETGPSIGVLAGVGAGAGLGWLATRTDPSTAAVRGAASGAVWGTGLAAAGLVWMEYSDSIDWTVVPLVAGADVGAALGVLVQQKLALTEGQLAYADLGLVIGTGAGLAIVGGWAVSRDTVISPQLGSGVVTLAGIGGGVLAGWLADPDTGGGRPLTFRTALLSGRPGELTWALPVPSAVPTADGVRLGVRLAACRF